MPCSPRHLQQPETGKPDDFTPHHASKNAMKSKKFYKDICRSTNIAITISSSLNGRFLAPLGSCQLS
jgi:hypothetical protein